MTAGRTHPILDAATRAALRADGCGPPDEALLREFIVRRAEMAFAALVRRHGPMVLGVCRRVLGSPHDAEDAFQATFLLLALKAATLDRPGQLGNWLYGVAYRTALEARKAAVRRRRKEAAVTAATEPTVTDPEPSDDLRRVLDHELAKLPEKYRGPVVLCDLQGRSRKDAAQQLRLKEGTLSSRLATARRLLAERLAGHGIRLPVAGLAALAAEQATAGVPPRLVAAAVQAASEIANGSAAAAVATARVGFLAGEVVKSMSRSRFKVLLLTLGVGALTAVTVSGFGQAPPGLAPGGGPRFPGVVPQPQAGRPENAAKKFQPLWGMSQAYVKLEGADTLRVRAELPVHGLVKLLDADNQPVSVHRFQPWQPPPFTVPVKEARVFDTRGREQAREDWLKLFRNEPLVLLATDAGQITPENIADAYRLFREDLLVVVLPGQAITQLDLSKAFPPVKSLPQAFPGQPPVPGGPTPPPPSGR